jgi:hypothetical protein
MSRPQGDVIVDGDARHDCYMGVDPADLDRIQERFGRRLPKAFRDYLLAHGPGEIDAHPDFYIELWTLEDVAAINGLPEVGGAFPYLFFFGGDGSREHLAFDYRREPPPVVMLDLVDGEEGLVEQSRDFEEFLRVVRSRGLDFGVAE